ncbi:MAG: hypothetical protein ABJF88_16775 [Rhodothermales bacterium]
MLDRVFSEEEVKAIIRRASARQEEEAERQEARDHGLTLADLEALGAEVGLDPKHLRAAADEVQTGRRAAVQAETQTATHVIVEHWVDRPFSDEAWEDTVALLRSRFGVDMGMWYGRGGEGRVERVGRAHEWVHMSQLGVETRISASEREGRTRVILSQRVGHAAPKAEGMMYGAFLGLIAGVIGAIPIADAFDSFWVYLVALVAIALVTTLVAGPIITRLDRRWREKKQRGLTELAADIEQTFEAVAPRAAEATPQAEASAPSESAPAATPRIDLDALSEEEGDAGATERSRTRS